jgi:flagellar assembly protein FliH
MVSGMPTVRRVSLAVLPELGGGGGLAGPAWQSDQESRAREILERAERQAQLVMEAARQKAAGVMAEGHREGLLQGRAEGIREGRARGAGLVRCLEEAADGLRALEIAWRARAEQTVVELALALAERILQTAVTQEPAHVLRATAAALAALPTGGEVTLRVHPDLVEIVEGSLEAVAAHAPANNRLRVLGDGALGLGGCVVEGPGILVDATYAGQLAEARRRLEASPW